MAYDCEAEVNRDIADNREMYEALADTPADRDESGGEADGTDDTGDEPLLDGHVVRNGPRLLPPVVDGDETGETEGAVVDGSAGETESDGETFRFEIYVELLHDRDELTDAERDAIDVVAREACRYQRESGATVPPVNPDAR